MKKSYMKVRPVKKNYFNTTWEAEANVDNGGFETTRYTHKVLREEVIDGKRYKVLSIWLDNDTTLWYNIGREWERYSIDGESWLQTALGIILERCFYDTLYWIPFQWERSGSYWGNSVNLSGQQLKTLTMVGSKPPLINLKQDRKHIGESWSTNDQIE